MKVYYSQDDLTNIQTGSVLRAADGASPLGVNLATDSPLLQYGSLVQPVYTIKRFDSSSSPAFNWNPLTADILNGGVVTLVVAAGTSTSAVNYYGGAGLSLEVSAHAVPEPCALGWISLACLGVIRRRGGVIRQGKRKEITDSIP
jgi:hypothetical protein